MWQRKQTIYFLVVILLLGVLEMLSQISVLRTSIAEIQPVSMGMSKYVFCQGIWDQNAHCFLLGFNSSLFIITLCAMLLALIDIFLYKNRKLQMRICNIGEMLLLLWYICLAVILYTNSDGASIKFHFGFFLPLLAMVVFKMAYRGIKQDDDLVKSADRIR